MVEHNRTFQDSSAEIFAEAVERLEAGEPLEVVLAAYPPEYRANLSALLAIVVKAHEIRQAPAPLPTPERRAAHKQAFMQAVAEKRADQVLVKRVGSTPPSVVAHRRTLWTAVVEAFTVRPIRLAPVALMLAILLLTSTTVVTLAQEAVPGDPAYPIKQWIRQQKIYLSPPEQRAVVRMEQEEELKEDLRAATTRPDLRNVMLEAEELMLFHSYGAGYLNIGGLRVLPYYEPDPNKPDTLPMAIVGELQPGKIVNLRYRLLPGQGGSSVPMVQGVLLEVIEQEPVEPTPLPTATPTIPSDCRVVVRSGWMPVNMQPGDTLASIAYRSGASLEELRLANCLSSDEVDVGSVLLIPAGRQQPEIQVSPIPTVVSTPAETATSDAGVTATLAPSPTATNSLTTTAPVASPATATPGATATPSLVFTATVIMPPTEMASPGVTFTAAPSVTTTMTATPTTTVELDEPSTPATIWPTVTPTPEKIVTATLEATPTPVESVTPIEPATPVAPETTVGTATTVMTATLTPMSTSTPEATEDEETSTPTSSPLVSLTPTSEAASSSTPDVTEAPTTQVTDTPTSAATLLEGTPEASATAPATPTPTEADEPPPATSTPPPTPTGVPPTPLPPPATNTPPPLSEENNMDEEDAPAEPTANSNEDA